MVKIQWYPGHMNKAKNQLKDKMKLLDVVVEVLDARIPQASRNPMIEKIVGAKPHLIILNKADLADPIITKRWQKQLQKPGTFVMALDSLHSNRLPAVLKLVKKAAAAKINKLVAKGAEHPTIRIAFVGIPNSGKSTIVNRLAGRNVAQTGNKPGVTKGQHWLRTNSNIQILDTPGILWPKFEDEQVGYKLAALGAIKDSVFPADDVALFLLKILRKYYVADLCRFARINKEDLHKIADTDLLLAMTQLYGMRDDYDRFSLYLLQRLRKGKLGRISLERP